MTQNTVFLFCAAGLVLSLAAVLVDRLNFPQRRFRPKSIEVDRQYSSRDRTGAHVNTLPNTPPTNTAPADTPSTSTVPTNTVPTNTAPTSNIQDQ